FANGRVKTVTASFGNLPAPYITDVSGVIIPGGEPKSNLLSCTLYEWNLEGTKAGEPVRFVIGKSGGSQIMQLNVTYEMTDDEIENGVASVTASESSNANFGTGSINVSAQTSFKTGATEAGVTCGIEYRDLMVPGDFHALECSLSDFRCSLSNLTGDRYAFRAWACSPKGWRVYSEEITAYTSCMKIDFWVNGAVNNPFSPGMKAGQSAASELAGTEQTYNLKEGGMLLRTFAPSSGTSYYIDINTASACRVSSGGTTMSQMTYFKFPAVQGKAIREVIVTRGGGSGKTYYICADPSTPQSAEETRMSSTLTLSSSGSTGTMSCPMALANTSYSLVFPEATMYNVRNVHVVYETAGSFSGDIVPDDQTLNPDDPSADPAGTFDYSRLKTLGHPRVLIDKAGFDQIRSVVTGNRSSNRFLCDVTDLIISYADKFVNAPITITYTLDASGKRLLTQSRDAFRQLSVMAYAYQITGQTKYVTRCRKILDDVCSFSDWHPSHFLDVGEMSLGVAIAYDWLYNVLTTEEKVKIRTALVDYGLKAGLQYGPSKFYNSDGNWNQVCNGGMVAAAIAVYEKDKTTAWQSIEKAVETNRNAIGLMYSPDGNYAEGYGYWGYGTGFQSMMMQMYETAFGGTADLADVQGFLKTAGYMQFMVGPCGPFSYADGGSSSESASIGMWWFAGHLKDKSLLCNEMRIYNKGKYGSGSDERLLPLVPAVVKDFNIDDFTGVHPSKNVWSGNGLVPVAMVHTGWNFDENDHYVGIKAGQANENHGHMDAGTFVYDALGQRWSADLTRPTYTAMENALGAVGGDFWSMGQKSLRWDIISMNNWCHSTISVGSNDGSVSKTYPTDHNVKGKCTILSVLDSSTEKGAVLDMSAPLQGQVA
ncbi:MAG: hypothetical protein ILO43_04275, partial [Clostridia bacterium]|nr:hypothetical protein [Clostridia bacterium]